MKYASQTLEYRYVATKLNIKTLSGEMIDKINDVSTLLVKHQYDKIGTFKNNSDASNLEILAHDAAYTNDSRALFVSGIDATSKYICEHRIDGSEATMTQKNLFAAQITYNNSGILIECLLNNGINYDLAEKIVSAVEDRKFNKRKYDKETWALIKKFVSIIKAYYSQYIDINIMLSKLTELVVLEKDLYLEIENMKNVNKSKSLKKVKK